MFLDMHPDGGSRKVFSQLVSSFTITPLRTLSPLILCHTITLSCEISVPQIHSVLKYCTPFDSTIGFRLVLSKNQFLPPFL